MDIRKGDKIIRIAAKHFPYALDMARSFDLYFSQVRPYPSGGVMVVDYSYPHLQHYVKFDLQFEISSFPEEAEAIQEYFRHYRPIAGEIVFDLGAYCGVSSYFLSQAVGPLGKVYAFEPDSANYSLLTRNLKRHGIFNVVPLQVAVAATTGTARFCSEGTMGSSLAEQMSRATVGTVVDTPTLSFEDACQRYGTPTFVKMDVEGSELDVLCGSRAFLREHAINFVLDTNHLVCGELTNGAVEKFFRACGYEVESSADCGSMTTWAWKLNETTAADGRRQAT